MRRLCLSMAMAFGIALAMTASTFAWQNRIEGQPTSFAAGSSAGVYFWHNEPAGLSLRTTDPPGESHEYTGAITTDGAIVNLTPVQLESNDTYSLDSLGQTLTFDFHTADEIDGLDFDIVRGAGMKLGAFSDGSSMPLAEFYLGQNSVHPVNNPMWFCREENGDCLSNLP